MRSERKMLPIGVENFEKLRRNDMYYVDKTEIIADLLRNHGDANLRSDRTHRCLKGLPSADTPISAKSIKTNTPLYFSA